MGGAFGVRALGTALIVICEFYRLQRQETQWASFPTLLEYRRGLPKWSRAPALQGLSPFLVVDCIQLLFAQAPINSTCADDLRVSTARGAAPSAQVELISLWDTNIVPRA